MLFNGQLYEHTDGVAMGSPLGLLLANVFMGSIEEILKVYMTEIFLFAW